jgi:hypothetical protein
VEVQLDARVVLKHLEADGVDAREEFLFGVDADIEVVVEEVVVGAVAAVFAAEDARPVRGLSRHSEGAGGEKEEDTHEDRITEGRRVGQDIVLVACPT